MGIYCQSISPGLKQFILQPKNPFQFVTFRFVDWHFHCKQIGNTAKILNLQTAILTFINDGMMDWQHKFKRNCISHF